MKAKIIYLYLFMVISCKAQEVRLNDLLSLTLPETLRLDFITSSFVVEKDVFAAENIYELSYDNDKVVLFLRLFYSDENSEILQRLRVHGLIVAESIGNIDIIRKDKSPTILCFTEGYEVKKYVYAEANEWTTDVLGYEFPLSGLYSRGVVAFYNIYSTYISKGDYISPWGQREIEGYYDKENNGILLYKYLDQLILTMRVHKKDSGISALMSASGVRLRAREGLSGDIITTLKKDQLVIIQDVTLKKDSIGKDVFPWIKVKTSDGLEGWVYGKYLSVVIP